MTAWELGFQAAAFGFFWRFFGRGCTVGLRWGWLGYAQLIISRWHLYFCGLKPNPGDTDETKRAQEELGIIQLKLTQAIMTIKIWLLNCFHWNWNWTAANSHSPFLLPNFNHGSLNPSLLISIWSLAKSNKLKVQRWEAQNLRLGLEEWPRPAHRELFITHSGCCRPFLVSYCGRQMDKATDQCGP